MRQPRRAASASRPTSTPTVDLSFAYSGGQRVLKSATLQGTTTTHTVEVLGSLRLEGTTFDVGAEDYVRDRFTECVFLGGIGRVVYDANGALPSPSGTNQHVYLQMGDHLGSTSVTIDGETGETGARIRSKRCCAAAKRRAMRVCARCAQARSASVMWAARSRLARTFGPSVSGASRSVSA